MYGIIKKLQCIKKCSWNLETDILNFNWRLAFRLLFWNYFYGQTCLRKRVNVLWQRLKLSFLCKKRTWPLTGQISKWRILTRSRSVILENELWKKHKRFRTIVRNLKVVRIVKKWYTNPHFEIMNKEQVNKITVKRLA